MKDDELWECPKCGRRFAKVNQWHSCLARAVEDHFRGKDPVLREIYQTLIQRMRIFGEVRIDAVRSSINLISKYHFGSVTVRKNHLSLGFMADQKIASGRITRTEVVGPHRVGHTVKLGSPGDVDDELLEWLKKAYQLQS